MSDELNESQRVLQGLEKDEYYDISGLISKLQLSNMKFQNKRDKRLREQRRQTSHQPKPDLPQQDEDADEQAASKKLDRYAEEELRRREREAKVTKSAANYVKHKNISIEVDVDDVDSDEDEDESNSFFDRDLYLLIENAFFPPKSKSKAKSKGDNISRDVHQLDFGFLQKDLDDSTNKFMLNILFGDAFKKINHEQSQLADQSLKKCVTEKTIGRFKLIGPLLEGAANQKNQL